MNLWIGCKGIQRNSNHLKHGQTFKVGGNNLFFENQTAKKNTNPISNLQNSSEDYAAQNQIGAVGSRQAVHSIRNIKNCSFRSETKLISIFPLFVFGRKKSKKF